MTPLSAPKMRTAKGLLEELQREDPDTEITLHYIRGIIKKGMLPVCNVGPRRLVNYDTFKCFLENGGSRSDDGDKGFIRPQ